jgi:asparagine synthase (glutamine-hydrolysing)
MAGFLIYQSACKSNARERLAFANSWFCHEKRLPIAGQLEHPRISLIKYGRRCSRSSDVVDQTEGWIATVGFWTHPQCLQPDSNAALLKLLLEQGSSVIQELDGMYAIAWYAKSTGILRVATDHIGRLHVFWATTSSGVFVSTSCIAIARAAPSDPDPVAAYEMLATGTMYEERTPFQGIRRIPAASVLEFCEGVLCRETRHSDLVSASRPQSEMSAEHLVGVLSEPVRRLLDRYDNPLSDLTGGLDSRLVLGLLLRMQRQVTVTVTGYSADPDVRVAKRLARMLGVDIEVVGPELIGDSQRKFGSVLDAATLSEGGYDPIGYAAISRVHSIHAGRYDVSINGTGGELLRNYWWDRSHVRNASSDIVKIDAQRFVRGTIVPPIVAGEFRLDLARHFEAVVRRCLDSVRDAPAYAKLDHLYIFLRMQCWQGAIASATNQIWPAVSPFLLRDVLNVVLRLNPLSRLGAKAMHQMFSICSPALATYPLETGFPPMAVSIPTLWRFLPGLGRAPFAQWRRVKAYRRSAAAHDESSATVVRDLFASGAADYFHFPTMSLRFCLDQPAFDRFFVEARTTGAVPLSLVGRLIAMESSYRAATARH